MQLYLWEAAPAPSALSLCNCSADSWRPSPRGETWVCMRTSGRRLLLSTWLVTVLPRAPVRTGLCLTPSCLQGNTGWGQAKKHSDFCRSHRNEEPRNCKYYGFSQQKYICYALFAASWCWRNPGPKRSATEQLPQKQLWCFVGTGEEEQRQRYRLVSQDSCKWSKRH